MAIRDSRVFRSLTRVEVLTILVCALWMASGIVPEKTRFAVLVTVCFAIILVGLAAAVSSAGACQKRLRYLKKHSVQVENGWLEQRKANSEMVGRIDLSRPFDVTIPHAGNGEGVYRVTQGTTSVEISSRLANAEHLVREVLKIKTWPPDAELNWL